jgi:hypothetical protein
MNVKKAASFKPVRRSKNPMRDSTINLRDDAAEMLGPGGSVPVGPATVKQVGAPH